MTARLTRTLVFAMVALLAASAASASHFTLLLDTDQNAETGCLVTAPVLSQPALAELRMDIAVDVSEAPPKVSAVSYAVCDSGSGTFGPDTLTTASSALGLGTGIDGSDVIELGLSLAFLGLPADAVVGLIVTSADALGVGTTVGSNPAAPIVGKPALIFADGFESGDLSAWSPTRNARAPGFVVDGQVGDWALMAPVISNPAGSSDPPQTDVRQVFFAEDAGMLFVRIDVTQLDVRPPPDPTVTDGPSQVDLTWPPVPGAASYVVYQCEVPADGPTTDLCAGSTTGSCIPVATVTDTSHADVPTSADGHCYRVQACSDAAGQVCGDPNSVADHGTLSPPVFPSAFIDGGAQLAYSGQQVVLHGYERKTTGAVTYDWKTPPGLTLCAGTDTTTKDLCFIAPTVSQRETLQFDFDVLEDGVFAAKAKVAVNVLPVGVVILTKEDQRRIHSGHTVSLHVSGTGGTSFQWVQTGPIDPLTGLIDPAFAVVLTGADTANPTFVAPAGLENTILTFAVTYTDSVTGASVVEGYALGGQTPGIRLTGQPLVTNQSSSGTGLAPQTLKLVAPAPAEAVGGRPVRLTMGAAFGTQPYVWSWTQVAPTDPALQVVLSGADTARISFTAPLITTGPQEFLFEAIVTDDNGSGISRKGLASVLVYPVPPLVTPATVTPAEILPPQVLQAGVQFAGSSRLTNAQIQQVAGYQVTDLLTETDPVTGGLRYQFTPPRLPVDTDTVRFVIVGEDRYGKIVHQEISVQISEPDPDPGLNPPRVTPPLPITKLKTLAAVNCGQPSAEAGQTEPVVLGVCAIGGSGSYTFAWAYTGSQPDIGASVSLSQGTTSHPTFVAPATIDVHKAALQFQAVVTDTADPAHPVTIPVLVTLYKPAGSADPGAPAQTVTASPGDAITLHAPTPVGGVAPYTYSLEVTDGLGDPVPGGDLVPGADPANWVFTPSVTPAAGTTDTYTATWTITDAVGNVQVDRTEVAVKAPADPNSQGTTPPPPGTPELNVGISTIDNPFTKTAQLDLSVHATTTGVASGETLTYAWQIQCADALPNRDPADPEFTDPGPAGPGDTCEDTTLRTLAATGDGLTLKLPYVAPPATGGTRASSQVTLTVTVTESGTGRTDTDTKSFRVQSVLKGSECSTCGDYLGEPKVECSRIDLILRKKETCSDETPYCMNDILQDSEGTAKLFKRCVDEAECKELWFMQSSDKVACFKYDPSTIRGELVCHLCCFGDGCNANILPPVETLYQP